MLDQVRGYLARHDPATARDLVMATLWSGNYRHDVLGEVRAAFLRSHHYNEAISLARFTLKQKPNDAAAHLHLGFAYRYRDRPGDPWRASQHLHRAFQLEPRWEADFRRGDATPEEPVEAQVSNAQGPL
jgi:Flp pilus assembly protein TadD